MKYVLSYGGGVNSSALFFYLTDKKMPLDLVIFADTGEETSSTYDAVKRMKDICLSGGIDFVTVQSPLGNLYEYYLKKKKVMSILRRDCTTKFKILPIRRYIREKYGKKEKFVLYIGITYDEFTRMRTSNVKYITNAYPFCEDKITRHGNHEILSNHNFIAAKSGCKGCIFTKKVEWIKMLNNSPDEFERHRILEENNSGYPKITLSGTYSLRSLKDAYLKQKKLDLFCDTEPTCDIAGGCFL